MHSNNHILTYHLAPTCFGALGAPSSGSQYIINKLNIFIAPTFTTYFISILTTDILTFLYVLIVYILFLF
jgi:hypothetical protein